MPTFPDPVMPNDAAAALSLIEQAGARSASLRGYEKAAPHMILWGAVYGCAYAFDYVSPAHAGLAWAVLVPPAIIGDIVIGRAEKRQAGTASARGWIPYATLSATFFLFIIASLAVLQPHDPRQVAAFIPLVVAAAYVVLGVGVGSRLILLGVALAALTLIGFFALPQLFTLWMALVGGGALILGGVWLRRI